jgi:hypothetical protein
MAQRISGYVRQANDSYETPTWVTDALVPHICSLALHVWEPAAGSGQMTDALRNAGFRAIATDIGTGVDFLKCSALPSDAIQAIVTNPPYTYAQAFSCCVRATTGHTAAPPRAAINSRRRIHPSQGRATVALRFARQQSRTLDVRFGSLADIAAALPNVRFTPESGRRTLMKRLTIFASE